MLSEVKDSNCSSRCIAHKNFWIDLSRIDECECGGIGKRFFSYHNYLFDIPMDKVFSLCNNINLIEMSKSIKVKSGKLSNDIGSINDLRGKIFLYFKTLLNQVKTDCPKNGIRCEINNCAKKFVMNNLPNYLTFNLQKICNSSVFEILQIFVMIPKIFDLSTVFEHSAKQKIFFEFFGATMFKQGGKNYACFFKNRSNNKWVHYDDETVKEFETWFDLVSFCLSNGQTVNMIFYHLQEKYTDSEKELTIEELNLLERYARNVDDTQTIVSNKFRQMEDLYPYEGSHTNTNSISEEIRSSISSATNTNSNYNNNPVNNNNHHNNLQKQNSSKNSTSISTSKNNSNNNSNSRLDLLDYMCKYCMSKNRIENLTCLNCHKNNEPLIEDVLKKRSTMTNAYNSSNNSANMDDKLSSIKRQSNLQGNQVANPFARASSEEQDEVNSNSKSK